MRCQLTLLFLTFLCTCVSAQRPASSYGGSRAPAIKGTIKGAVVDAGGVAIEYATIVLLSADGAAN